VSRRELQRIAKEWFMAHGTSGKQNFAQLQYRHDLDDEDMLIVQDYFNMTVRRAHNELFR